MKYLGLIKSKEIDENGRSRRKVRFADDVKDDKDDDVDVRDSDSDETEMYSNDYDDIESENDDEEEEDEEEEEWEEEEEEKEEDEEDEEEDEDEDEDEDEMEEQAVKKSSGRRAVFNKFDLENGINDEEIAFAESDDDMEEISDQDDDDSVLDGALRWKSNLAEKAKEMFFANRRVNIMELIYDSKKTPHEIASGDFSDLLKVSENKNKKDNMEGEEDDEEFFKIAKSQEKDIDSMNVVDSTKACLDTSNLDKWGDEDVSICFINYQLYLVL
jgi:ribosome biogenesis protein BMS1